MKWNKTLRLFTLLCSFTLTTFQLQAGDKPVESLSIAAPISAPFVFKDKQKQPQGLLVEFFALVQQQTGIKTHINVMPWPRGLHEVKVGRIDALMPTIYTDERAQFLFYPKSPLLAFHTVLLKRANEPLIVDDITKLGTDKTIVKIRSMSMGKVFDQAEKDGLIRVIEVRDFDHAMQMLVTHRADLVACVEHIADSSLRRLNLADKVETLFFSDKVEPGYLTFSKRFSKEYDIDEFMEKIQFVQSTPQYQVLVEKFLK